MPSSLEMACFGGSNRCAHRWKQRQTSPEKPVGTSVGIGAPGSAENTRKMAFGEIVSPVGPTSSFVAAAQRRGSCQTHHRACSKSSSWKSACQAGSTNFVLTVQRRLPRPLSRDRPAEVVCTSHLCRPADFGRIPAGWAKDYERQFIAQKPPLVRFGGAGSRVDRPTPSCARLCRWPGCSTSRWWLCTCCLCRRAIRQQRAFRQTQSRLINGLQAQDEVQCRKIVISGLSESARLPTRGNSVQRRGFDACRFGL